MLKKITSIVRSTSNLVKLKKNLPIQNSATGPFEWGLNSCISMYFVISISAYSYDNVVKSFFEIEFRWTYVFTHGIFVKMLYEICTIFRKIYGFFHDSENHIAYLSLLCYNSLEQIRINNKAHEKKNQDSHFWNLGKNPIQRSEI